MVDDITLYMLAVIVVICLDLHIPSQKPVGGVSLPYFFELFFFFTILWASNVLSLHNPY